MKLIFFPVLLYSLISRKKRSAPALNSSLLLGNILGTLSIPVFFYTYTGILGKHMLPVDIAIFLIGLLIVFYTAWKYRNSRFLQQHRKVLYCLTLLFVAAFWSSSFFSQT